jgi:SAM-dependent methyltransferase
MASGLPSGALAGFADGPSYDKHRPSYPPEAVSSLLAHMGLAGRQGARVVDLAAGTGKFTELLAARGDERFELLAVEPHDGMRAELERKEFREGAAVVVKKGLATDIPIEDGWADGLICAQVRSSEYKYHMMGRILTLSQSFHWFSTLDALASISRALKPNASLGLIWNVEDYNNTLRHPSPHPWTLTLRRLLFALDAQSPADTPALRFRNETWRRVFAPGSGGADRFFAPLREEEFAWTTHVDADGLWARFRTLSQIAALDGAELADAKKLFDEAIAGPGTERDAQGRIAVRGITLIAWTQRAS